MMHTSDASGDNRVAIWLMACCAMIFIMVVVGGLTRLTGSGLSMVEWQPVVGWLPPLDEQAWQRVFALYRQSPQFTSVNFGMDLEGFKGIFWLEYIHRLIGRLTGVVFIVPLIWFAIGKQVSRRLAWRFSFIFLMGAVQGGIGWYMVQSGLKDNPMVSPYRLTLHLGFAIVIYAVILWSALDLWRGKPLSSRPEKTLVAKAASWLLGLVFLTILSGGFVAGLHAGLTYNTFPLMDGRWMPLDYLNYKPAYLAFFEHVPSVQWDHRVLATSVFVAVFLFWIVLGRRVTRPAARTLMHAMVVMAGVQVTLGISTLVLMVPIALASLHQAGAVVLFTLVLILTHHLFHPRS
ncbi:MAG: COX15/CtaA family protein [Magnetococcales bacterium]|nr:COX15/CtaA family protein [Magnetococcales bacterium]